MTIKELKLSLNDIKIAIPMTKKTIDMAIDIIRKYQKIKQILDDCDLEAWEILEKVKEVVEDGNNRA